MSRVAPETEKQSAKIRAWLRAGQPITPLQALKMFQCNRLAARIHDLRKLGMRITTNRVKTPSGKTIAQYTL